MNPVEQAPPATAPEIFILAGDGELYVAWLTRFGGHSARWFSRDEIPSLISEFRVASPRPRLLIAQRMSGVGVRAAQACREIEPGLKVVVLSGLSGSALRDLTEGPKVADVVLGMPFKLTELTNVTDLLIGAPGQAPAVKQAPS